MYFVWRSMQRMCAGRCWMWAPKEAACSARQGASCGPRLHHALARELEWPLHAWQ